MITAQEVREKAKELNKIQEQEQLLKEENQLIEIERDIMAAIKEDANTTSILVQYLSSNNKSSLKD